MVPLCVPSPLLPLPSPLYSPILTLPLTVRLCTPGLHKLGPWKTRERREKRDAWRNKRKGGEGVWSMGSFSIPMEQKVNDGAIVLWESWLEEKCYRESWPVPLSSDKRGPAISNVEFLPYLYRLHVHFWCAQSSPLLQPTQTYLEQQLMRKLCFP